jgi:hypothetical protein
LCLSTRPTSKWHFVSGLNSQLWIPKVGLSQFWGPITLCLNLQLQWNMKQSCSYCRELSNVMSHPTCTKGNRVDSWLLMVGSQTADLTLGLSFGHNLCSKCPNGSCELILDIYVSIDFQWYKKLFNPMGFDPFNFLLKIWDSIGSQLGLQLPKWEFTWECEGSFPHTLLYSR